MNRIVLSRLADPLLEPDLARARRGSCRARRAAAPRRGRAAGTPAPAASARRRTACVSVAVLRPVVGHAERRTVHRRPRRPRCRSRRRRRTRPAPRRSHLGLLVVGLHQRQLAARRPRPRPRGPAAATTESSRSATVGSSLEAVADHLAHHAEPAGAGDRTGVRHQVAGDDPQQRGLAGAVGADQRDLGALADPERHVVEQHPAVGQLVAHPGDVHVTHDRLLQLVSRLGATHGPPARPRLRTCFRSATAKGERPASGRQVPTLDRPVERRVGVDHRAQRGRSGPRRGRRPPAPTAPRRRSGRRRSRRPARRGRRPRPA